MTSPINPAMSATCCKRWDDGGCDFGCQCDDCKPVPMTPEQVREYYASLCPDDEDEVFRCRGCWMVRLLSRLDDDGYCVTCSAFAIREKNTVLPISTNQKGE